MVRCKGHTKLKKRCKKQCARGSRCYLHKKTIHGGGKYKKICTNPRDPAKLNKYGYDEYQEYKDICKPVSYDTRFNMCDLYNPYEKDMLYAYVKNYSLCARERRKFSKKCMAGIDHDHEKVIEQMIDHSRACYAKAIGKPKPKPTKSKRKSKTRSKDPK